MRTGLVKFEKLSFSWIRLVEESELKKLLRFKYFQVLIPVYFLLLLLRYIHLMSTDVYMHNIPLYKGLLENQS